MKQEYTITVYTENQVGLLNRIAIIFSRRKINIESLNVSPSEAEGIHRFTIVINEFEEVVRKLCRQIERQVEVLKAYFNIFHFNLLSFLWNPLVSTITFFPCS
jgi:acetolactate synthase-1/3 small subunit